MRFPICDLVPIRTRPVISALAAALAVTGVLAAGATPLAVAALSAHVLVLFVLGATVEDQMGPPRFLGLLGLTAAAGLAWTGLTVWAALAPATGAVGGAHLSLFPRGRLTVGAGPWFVEVPSFLLPGLWAVSVVWLSQPGWPAVAAALGGAAVIRWVRRPDAGSWPALDTAR